MSRFHSYINSSKRILDAYDAVHPFPFHVKKHFAANKQFGSRDRKMISEICYAWFRTSHLFDRNLQDSNMINALFLCTEVDHPLLAALAPELNGKAAMPALEKLAYLQLKPAAIFPFEDCLGSVDHQPFTLSFLIQPLLFLRLRPGSEQAVIDKLHANNIPFSEIEKDCIALPNATKLEEKISLNKEAVVQDRNSQQVFNYLVKEHLPAEKINVWDCCVASGGKSILLYDRLNGQITLTVSDIRESMLHNCKQRLQEAGIKISRAFVADIATQVPNKVAPDFSIIICDAPCTGSGTWSRTPEQLAYFKKEKIEPFSVLQKSIATNASKYLKKGGLFFYITCSVFKQENEEVVASLQQETGMQLLYNEYLPGYLEKADTMFVAVFKKTIIE